MIDKKLPISVFIIAKNEADRIATTIGSVREWVDEVIVIDGGSTDETIAVAKENGAKVEYNQWAGYGLQKRFGEDLCQNNWLLNLDADEEISQELAQEIQELFTIALPLSSCTSSAVGSCDCAHTSPSLPSTEKKLKHYKNAGNPEVNSGYTIDIYQMLRGEIKLPAKTQMNRVLRLYDKRKGRFSDSPVHDSVIIREGNVSALKGAVYHRSYRSLTHAIEKINSYSTMLAEDLIKRGVKIPKWRLYAEFPASFIKGYFFRGYIFRGSRGFSYAMLYAFSRLLRLAKYYEIKE